MKWAYTTFVQSDSSPLLLENIQFIISNIIEVENTNVKIYPNPVKDELIIDSNGLTITKLEIFDLLGKKINSQLLNNKSVNVSALPRGIYFVKLEMDKGILTRKFIKQ